jgi:hypothetical protein
MSIAADGDVAYVGENSIASPPGVKTYYFTDPYSSGSYISSTPVDGAITDIELYGHLAYYVVFDTTSGYSLRVLYAEDPDNPVNIPGSWMDSSKALGLAVEGNLAYVTAAEDGLFVVNTSNINNFFTEGHVGLPGNATDVVIDGGFAYVASGDEGVFAIDIQNKFNPQLIGHFDTPGYARKLVLQGNTLFVADGTGVIVLDVADPFNPLFVTDVPIVPYVYDVDLYGGYLVVSSDDGLHTFLIQAGGGIANIASSYFENSYDDKQVWEVRVRGDLAYIAGGADGFYVLNIRNPNDPILVGEYSIPVSEELIGIDLDGDVAHLIERNFHYMFDIQDPTNLKLIDKVAAPNCNDIYANGNIAFLAYSDGVIILNETDPYNWAIIQHVSISTNISAVWVQGRYLYACEDLGTGVGDAIWIYDITDMSLPVLVGSDVDNTKIVDMYGDGDIILTSERSHSVAFNCTNPASPFWSGWSFPASFGVWGFGPYLLSANPYAGVDIFDAHNIASYSLLYSNTNASSAWKITTKGDYTYVSNLSSLVILRHFLSAGDTYIPGNVIAQSLEVDSFTNGVIKLATLDAIDFVPHGTFIDYYMSADGGLHWEPVTPGIPHEFVNPGNDLRWLAEFIGPEYRSAHLYHIEINFDYNEAPSVPTIAELGDKTFGSFKVDWDDSTDDVAVDHYLLQMSDSLSFIDILQEWTTTKSQKSVSISKGTYYFRVQAVDDEGLSSVWSLAEITTVKTSGAMLYVIIGGGALVLIAAIVIPLVLIMRKKKKGMPTR